MALRRGILNLNHRNTSNNIFKKSSSLEPLGSDARNLVCGVAWWSFTKFVQRSEEHSGPAKGGPRFEPKIS